MNNGYFFGLLDRMISGELSAALLILVAETIIAQSLMSCSHCVDVLRQPDNGRKKDLMDQLQEINKRTNAQRQTMPNHAKH